MGCGVSKGPSYTEEEPVLSSVVPEEKKEELVIEEIPQSITISAPSSASKWIAGNNEIVAWKLANPVASSDGSIKIELYVHNDKENVLLQLMEEDIDPLTSCKLISFPPRCPDGSKYGKRKLVVKVSTVFKDVSLDPLYSFSEVFEATRVVKNKKYHINTKSTRRSRAAAKLKAVRALTKVPVFGDKL